MNRDTAHLARERYSALSDVLADLVLTAETLDQTCRDELLVNTSDLAFLRRRLTDLALCAKHHADVLEVIPHQIAERSQPGGS